MECEICGAAYKQLGTDLVCENGHTLQNTLEVVDDEFGAFKGRRRRIRQTRGEEISYDTMHPSVAQLVIFRSLFVEAMDFFGILSDRIYRYLTSFFRLARQPGTEEADCGVRIESDHIVSGQALAAIIYLGKRSEMEASGRPYFFAQFKEEMGRFKLNYRIRPITKKHRLRSRGWTEMLLPNEQTCIIALSNQVREIADFDVFSAKRTERSEAHSTGVLPLDTEHARVNIRRLFSRDPKLLVLYLKDFCSTLDVEVTEDLLFYFNKYVYTFDYRRLFVPELSFLLFIASYFVEQGVFANTRLEGRVLQFLKVSKQRLLLLVNDHARYLSGLCSPDMLIKSREADNAARFINLRRAIWIIDTFKENGIE